MNATACNREVISRWLSEYPYQLKFVVTSPGDIDEIQELLSRLSVSVEPDRVLLMPEGTTSEQLRHHTDSIVELCKKYGYRYGSRLHIDLFGHTRGT